MKKIKFYIASIATFLLFASPAAANDTQWYGYFIDWLVQMFGG